jgi:predicted molibdopterin-dependent oxidoreductase YjgC
MVRPDRTTRAQPTRTFTFTFDGRQIEAEAGQSVAAALIGAGVRAWRRTRISSQPRGVFCGIGVCFDCLVTVNGSPSRRACLVEVQPGDAVVTQEGAGHGDLAC